MSTSMRGLRHFGMFKGRLCVCICLFPPPAIKLEITLTSEMALLYCLRADALSLMRKLLVLALNCSLKIRSWQPWHVEKCFNSSSIKVHKECCLHLIRFIVHHVLFSHHSCNCQDTSHAPFSCLFLFFNLAQMTNEPNQTLLFSLTI